MELKGSKTEANLLAAFAGEAQAYTKYLYYASKAKSDGYVQISNLFTETAFSYLNTSLTLAALPTLSLR